MKGVILTAFLLMMLAACDKELTSPGQDQLPLPTSTEIPIPPAGPANLNGDPSVGDVIQVIDLPTPGSDVGVAFDGLRVFYTAGGTDLHSFDPADPAGTDVSVGVTDVSTGSGLDMDALAYDVTRDLLWAVQHGTENIYQVDKNTGSAVFQFSATGKCSRCIGSFKDGLAFDAGDPSDPADDAIWWSHDVDTEVFKLDLTGATLESFFVNSGDLSDIVISSGIAVGGPNLYLANNGLDEIFRVDKATTGLVDQFAFIGGRPEDMECDPVTFAPIEVMWVRTLETNQVTALAIEAGTCGLGGGSGSPLIEANIDIKPGSDPNSINLKNKRGVTPVAVLGSAELDVRDIDVATLLFGDLAEDESTMPAHDLTDILVLEEHIQDVNGDGLEDLVSHYSTQDTGIDLDDTEACIKGETIGGTPFEGCDSVRIPGSGN